MIRKRIAQLSNNKDIFISEWPVYNAVFKVLAWVINQYIDKLMEQIKNKTKNDTIEQKKYSSQTYEVSSIKNVNPSIKF